MKTTRHLSLLFPALTMATATHAAFQLTVESFRDGNIPAGYINVTDTIQPEDMLQVSDTPYLDYLIPNNQGSVGITAQKTGGTYITSSTVAELPAGGSNRGSNPDRYHPVFEWFDGDPLPFGSEYFGVSWGGWSASEVASLTTQISLQSTDPILISHWFNDGWNYADGGHDSLSGHKLTVSLYDAGGTLKQQQVEVLPSGGAEDVFGDHRQFYTALIAVSGHTVGDQLIILNEGGNVGYKGTAVATGSEIVDPEPSPLEYVEGEYRNDARLGYLFGLGQNWVLSYVLGTFFDSYPWLYLPAHGWIYHLEGTTMPSGAFFYSDQHGVIMATDVAPGYFYIYNADAWATF